MKNSLTMCIKCMQTLHTFWSSNFTSRHNYRGPQRSVCNSVLYLLFVIVKTWDTQMLENRKLVSFRNDHSLHICSTVERVFNFISHIIVPTYLRGESVILFIGWRGFVIWSGMEYEWNMAELEFDPRPVRHLVLSFLLFWSTVQALNMLLFNWELIKMWENVYIVLVKWKSILSHLVKKKKFIFQTWRYCILKS